MYEEIEVAMALPVGDQESERMLGARPVGRPVSARTTGLMPLNVEGNRSFFKGREVFGGAIVKVDVFVYVVRCCWWFGWRSALKSRTTAKLELKFAKLNSRARQLEWKNASDKVINILPLFTL